MLPNLFKSYVDINRLIDITCCEKEHALLVSIFLHFVSVLFAVSILFLAAVNTGSFYRKLLIKIALYSPILYAYTYFNDEFKYFFYISGTLDVPFFDVIILAVIALLCSVFVDRCNPGHK